MPNRTLWFSLFGIAGAIACGAPSKENFTDPIGASGEGATGGGGSGKGGSSTTGGSSGKGGTGSSTGGTGGSSGSSSSTGGSGGAGGSTGGGSAMGGAGGSGGATGGAGGTGGSGSETGGVGGTGGTGSETGGAAGMANLGGIGSQTGGAGGTGGMNPGNGGSAGSSMDPDCTALMQAYSEALAAARSCNADSGKDQCTHLVSSSPTCGCPVFVNPDNEEAIAELARLSKAAAKCDFVCTDVVCLEPEGGTCVAEANDGGLCRSK